MQQNDWVVIINPCISQVRKFTLFVVRNTYVCVRCCYVVAIVTLISHAAHAASNILKQSAFSIKRLCQTAMHTINQFHCRAILSHWRVLVKTQRRSQSAKRCMGIYILHCCFLSELSPLELKGYLANASIAYAQRWPHWNWNYEHLQLE